MVKRPLFSEHDFWHSLFNAIPSPVYIVDADAGILYSNAAAQEIVSRDDAPLLRRSGEALHCLNARETPEGCGRAGACRECTIRNSVTEAISGGKIYRKKATITQRLNGRRQESHFLVTASPFQHGDNAYSLLILEDISELLQLRSLIPICAWCRKVRTDQDYWQNVEEYFHARLDMTFSQGICEECRREQPGEEE